MRFVPSRVRAGSAALAAGFLITASLGYAEMKPYQIDECGEQSDRIGAALDDAVEKIRGPLKALSPKKAQAALKLLNGRKVSFKCSFENTGHGGSTDFFQDGRVEINLSMRSAKEQYPFAQRIFHELLHGIDPKGKLIVTAKVHARSGFPDPVYGCQLAAYRSVWFSDGERTILNYETANDLVIPEEQDYSCDGIESASECKALRKYAHICGMEKPFVKQSTVNAAKRKQLPSCVFESLVNQCERKVCLVLRKGIEDDIKMVASYGGNGISGNMRAASRELGEKLCAAFDAKSAAGLNPQERQLFQAAKQKRYFQTCLE